MTQDKIEIPQEVKRFKEGLEKIRREELLAEELVRKARIEADEITGRSHKKAEELIRQGQREAEIEGEELCQKMRDVAETAAEELKLKGEEIKKQLTRKARLNLPRAVEFVIKKIME